MSEAKPGEVTLVYNTADGAFAVGLSHEQHMLLQILVQSLGKIQVAKMLKIEYVKQSP
jgi:hypothetical protein